MSRLLKDYENQITKPYNKLTHKGIDLVGYKAKTCWILAHSDGVVVDLKTDCNKTYKIGSSYGNYVKIKHNDGYYTLYAHLKYGKVKVKKGQVVKQGEEIGYMGNTGHSDGAHLHWEVRNEKDTRINPTPYLEANLPEPKKYYQVYDNKKNKWLAKVEVGSNDYAGNFKNAISGLRIDKLTYRVHDKVKNKWLPWVTGSNDYAGNLSNDIDGVQIKEATYRVHIKGEKWLDWVSKADNAPNGYAGIYGKSIDAIQIK